MAQYRAEYMVGGTFGLPSRVIESNVRAWVVDANARRFFQLWFESQKEPEIRTNPIVEVVRPVSRVEMNAKERRP